MRAIEYPAQAGKIAATRLLLLPGAFNEPEDLARRGFVAAVRARGLALDLTLVDPQLAHLTDRTIVSLLHQELVLPARAAGCRSIWLAGVSLGAFIAICYAERYPEQIEGLCLIAPYLGSRIVAGEVAAANGVRGWEPGKLTAEDDERRIWRYIKTWNPPPQLHVGLGHDDRFADSHALLVAALPPECLDRIPGGHDWPTWLLLWDNFLDRRFERDPR